MPPCEYCVPQPPPKRYTSRPFHPGGSHASPSPGVGIERPDRVDAAVDHARLGADDERHGRARDRGRRDVGRQRRRIRRGASIEPSCARYDHVVVASARRSRRRSRRPSPRPRSCRPTASRCGPEKSGPFFEWFVTSSATVSSPAVAVERVLAVVEAGDETAPYVAVRRERVGDVRAVQLHDRVARPRRPTGRRARRRRSRTPHASRSSRARANRSPSARRCAHRRPRTVAAAVAGAGRVVVVRRRAARGRGEQHDRGTDDESEPEDRSRHGSTRAVA